MFEQPCVVVGIVLYNSLSNLPSCLDALRKQTWRNIRIVALDNASSDETVAWVKTCAPDIELLRSAINLGFARGHNLLIKHTFGQFAYYLALNPDTTLSANYIETLVLYVEEQAQIGWATGKLLLDAHNLYSVGHALCRDGYAINIGYGMPDTGQWQAPREVFGAPGAAALLRASLIADLGFPVFDEAMFLYNEDVDLDWRAQRLGWRCAYVPDAVALHRGSDAPPHLRVEALANRYLSVIKNAYWLDLLTYNAPLIVLHVLVRLVLTPRTGVQLFAKLFRFAPRALSMRRESNVSWRRLKALYRWSHAQPTGQPHTIRDRIRSFLHQQQRSSPYK